MNTKQVILEIESVYTANAFRVGPEIYIGAGSETKPEVYLYNITTGETSQVTGSPGGMMSFIPVPGNPDMFVSIMGLFPPFVGGEAGLFLHRRTNRDWHTTRALHLPFAHRCEILNRDGKNFLFAATVSTYKENPQDWSNPGELHLIKLDDTTGASWESRVIDNSITRNHGMTRTRINGHETICISGREGIFYLEQDAGGDWRIKSLFEKEVSEMTFIDLDGDGQYELVTIEPFHGETLNIYKNTGSEWDIRFSDSLSFGHGLSSGFVKQKPVIVVGNRSGSMALESFHILDLKGGKFNRAVIEEDAGPTQTQVFSAGDTDYVLSANQRKNEAVLYY
ncbi:MAG: hypothetical protein AMS23_01590 [Bacteroides sp. SM1_62]|nr:MAG: hypothetical protein AMS26_07870 [Bacteroides sp. SM23_62]KPL26489.1 MAG: hypothetical protein AMS23_01590 [Bacteroides sp. SM1_62]